MSETCESDFLHVYDWLLQPTSCPDEKKAKRWLRGFTLPAYVKFKPKVKNWLNKQKVTVEWKGERYICSGASSMGDVWLKKPTSSNFYDHRVPVEELSNWQVTEVTVD